MSTDTLCGGSRVRDDTGQVGAAYDVVGGVGMSGQATITPWLKAAFRLPDVLYRNGLGWVLGRRFLRLLHVGRHTGKRHATVLEVLRHGPRRTEFVVVSGFGTRTDWLRNIEAGNPVEVTVGRRTFVADHRGSTAKRRSR